MEKKAVITICGLIGASWDKDSKKYIFKDKKAIYKNDSIKELKKDKYINMLPLLIDSYSSDYDIIALATKDAKIVQNLVLEDYKSEDKVSFSDISEQKENEYSEYFKMVNKLLEGYEEVIIDLSHGFRHIPLLTLIALIMQNIKNQNKIKHILFAQEIKREEEYKIIDLIEYLDLANLSFMLSTFNDNYTVSNNIKFKNKLYTKISKELSQFSHHFLSNSLKPLIEGDLVTNIIEQLNELKKEESINNFGDYIDEISNHLQEIKMLNQKIDEFEKLYELSQIMSQRGYLLNAITMLFEAIGFYCATSIKKISSNLEKHIKYFEDELIGKKEPITRYSTYTLVNQSRNIIKLSKEEKSEDRFRGDYLYNPETVNLTKPELKKITQKPKGKIEKIRLEIENFLKPIDIEDFVKFIREMEALRNNLAHGNTSDSLEDVQKTYDGMLRQFEKFCIKDNILQKNGDSKKDDISSSKPQSTKPKTSNDLQAKFNNR